MDLEWLKAINWLAVINAFISFSAGLLIGATEIISTFQYRKDLLKMASLWMLLFFYGFMGLIAYALL